MSLRIRREKFVTFTVLTVVLACSGFPRSLAAQTPEPEYQFEFVAADADTGDGGQAGILRISVLPPLLHERIGNAVFAVPAILALDSRLYSGQWLADVDSEELAAEQERFVLGKFMLFQTAERLEQYQQWLDPETYSTFSEAIDRNEIDLESDREIYQQYDNIRLLGSVRYGVYSLLYTQFRTQRSGELTTSVMPARYVDGRLVTAGSLHASSHELYRMLAFGTLQRQLMDYLETRVKN